MAAQKLSPEQRSLRAKVAVNTRWANSSAADRKANSQRAIAGQLEAFARQVDPNNELPEAERQRRAEHARKAHMARLSLKASRARSANRARRPDDGGEAA